MRCLRDEIAGGKLAQEDVLEGVQDETSAAACVLQSNDRCLALLLLIA